jgi:alkanesulfonate monooxygenase SsuD/methylene tetrahydromethanopterin reductase-like flavin-dependent oxidoreductase (luciferase family)
VRRVASEADGWNRWGVDVATFTAEVGELRESAAVAGGQPPERERVEVSWGGQVLVGRTEAEAADKLARVGPRPGLVHGTIADLTVHLAGLVVAGASWAVCAPLDVGSDPEAVELVAEAAAPLR